MQTYTDPKPWINFNLISWFFLSFPTPVRIRLGFSIPIIKPQTGGFMHVQRFISLLTNYTYTMPFPLSCISIQYSATSVTFIPVSNAIHNVLITGTANGIVALLAKAPINALSSRVPRNAHFEPGGKTCRNEWCGGVKRIPWCDSMTRWGRQYSGNATRRELSAAL